jgi:hypothetical protein
MSEEAFEPARRELCPDETCVGLIGVDGRCKVCGSVGASAVADPRRQGMAVDTDATADATDALDDDRELCPDGACIGVIGDDGLCKVCGAQGTAPAPGTPRAPRPALAAAPAAPAAADLGAITVDDEDRELCPDGSCIGLIGPDGRCKVCGISRASASP